jgi:hypothetical protein
MALKNHYICPKCRGFLNIGDNIIFTFRKKTNESGLFMLSSKVGDYAVLHHPAVMISKGEHYIFHCPLCRANLSIPEVHENLAKIIMIDDQLQESIIVFSGIAGEKCTYKISGSEIETYGENQAKYLNFMNLICNK